MKKGLFATTAIVAAAAAVSLAPQNATAQDDGGINLGVGGYYDFFYTLSDQDEPDNNETFTNDGGDFRADRVRSEGEIEFSGDATLDNGITVGVNVQLEAESAGDQIDEHYMFVEGSFGRIQVGAENSAPYAMTYAAPDVGILVNSPDFRPFRTAGLGVFQTSTFIVGSSDANKLTYFTPRMAGIQLGGSYTPDTENTSGAPQGTGLVADDAAGRAYGVGVNYVNSFNGFDVAVSGGYEMIESETAGSDDRDDLSAGLNIGYAGFTVGGSYRYIDGLDGAADVSLASGGSNRTLASGLVLTSTPGQTGTVSGGELSFTDAEAQIFDLGVSYETGPWGTSLSWLHGETEFDQSGAEDTHDSVVASLSYTLGPGINAVGNVHYINLDAESTGYDGDGYAGSLGMMLSF